ncbi:MAG: secretion protein, partial [Acetobacter orientalis]
LKLRHSEQKSAGLFYQSTILNAWNEVENRLSYENFFLTQYKRQISLLSIEKSRIKVLQKRQQRGNISRQEVLEADLSKNTLHASLANTYVALLTNAVNLQLALGARD